MPRSLASVRVKLEPGFERAVTGLSTPALAAAADIVAEGQRRRIPVSPDGSHGRPAGYAKGKIHTEFGVDALGPYADAGTFDDALSPDGYNYPVGLELGTPAHEIRSKGDYPLRNKKTGQIFGRVVQHPGTAPQPWCRVALADLVGRTLP